MIAQKEREVNGEMNFVRATAFTFLKKYDRIKI